MMRLSESKITKFSDDEGFSVYIEEKDDQFEAWIGYDRCGIIEHIYGVPKVKPHTGETETLETFTTRIMEQIIEHKYFYIKQWIMEDIDDDC